MTPEEKVDEALDLILKASGSGLKHYTMKITLDKMRQAMRKIMAGSYIEGSNDCAAAMREFKK